MSERTEHAPGIFSWADLSTTDLEAAKSFYSGLFGWEFEDMPAGDEGQIYSMARLRGQYVAAASPMWGEQQGPPRWNAYVTVEDVDAKAGEVSAAGGTVVMPPFDVFDSGRMTVFTDPTGAFLSLWQPRQHIGAGLVTEPGALTWNDLNTDDPDAAMAFYEPLFGWAYDQANHDYWTIRNGDRMNGGIRRKSENEAGMPNYWGVTFGSADIEETGAKAEAAGGRKIFGPIEAGPGRYAWFLDPQGAAFAVYSGPFEP
jgi:predicted enzyme related to lactoylglutathione lyase